MALCRYWEVASTAGALPPQIAKVAMGAAMAAPLVDCWPLYADYHSRDRHEAPGTLFSNDAEVAAMRDAARCARLVPIALSETRRMRLCEACYKTLYAALALSDGKL